MEWRLGVMEGQRGSKDPVLYFGRDWAFVCLGFGYNLDQVLFLNLDFGLFCWIRLVYKGNKPKDLFCKF